jgi:hypothetical protein
MLHLATPIVDWTAMWKIFLVALAAGAGTVIAFGFVLLGLKFAQGPATHAAGADGAGAATTGHASPSAGARLGGFTLALVCGLICVGVIAAGVYAMTQKPKSKPAAKPKSALVIPAGSHVRLVASSS